jgi:hypothetical protein
MKKILMVGALVLFSCSHAYAKARYIATSGLYLTGDVGYGILFAPGGNIVNGQGVDLNSVGWSGGIGYNWALDSFNFIGVETDYFDNGGATYKSSTGNLQIHSATVAALLSYTSIWENGVDVFLKGGVGYLQQTNNVQNGYVQIDRYNNLTGSGTNGTVTGVGVIGVGYYLAKGLNLFVDTTYVYGSDDRYWNHDMISGNSLDKIEAASSLQFKLGLSYQF